jgi:NIMA (never in mitosis gene a)-related kinase
VHAALRHSNKQLYAVKVVPMRDLNSSDTKSTLNEVRILASIKHPHIIGYKEARLHGQDLQVIMEFAAGGDLKHRILKLAERC